MTLVEIIRASHMKRLFVSIHVLNPHLGWVGWRLTNPSQPLITQRERAKGNYSFGGQAHDRHSLFVCVHERVCMCESTVQSACDSSPTLGLHRAMEALFRPASPYKARCVLERGFGISPQIFVLAAGRPLSPDTVKRCIDDSRFCGSSLLWLVRSSV